MKIALCFLISYQHKLNKEDIWKKWIQPNDDIINIYFHYKDINKIQSKWILKHAIPSSHIVKTSYFHVVPAYISILSYAYFNDQTNTWFCLLTDSCVPIISPDKFRKLFFENYNSSIFNWSNAWWNVQIHRRANLQLLTKDLRLGHDPWFILKREHVFYCINFVKNNNKMFNMICSGGLANESIFAIILKINNQLDTKSIINYSSTITDWTRMTSSTSPHLFKDGNNEDIEFINNSINKNPYAIFLRKVDSSFPDIILNNYTTNISNHNITVNNIIMFYILISILLFFGVIIIYIIF
jgi:hypothetical protein